MENATKLLPTILGVAALIGATGGFALGGIAWAVGGLLLAMAAAATAVGVASGGLVEGVQSGIKHFFSGGKDDQAGTLGDQLKKTAMDNPVTTAGLVTVAVGGPTLVKTGAGLALAGAGAAAKGAVGLVRPLDDTVIRDAQEVMAKLKAVDGSVPNEAELKKLERYKSRSTGMFGGNKKKFHGGKGADADAINEAAKFMSDVETKIAEGKAALQGKGAAGVDADVDPTKATTPEAEARARVQVDSEVPGAGRFETTPGGAAELDADGKPIPAVEADAEKTPAVGDDAPAKPSKPNHTPVDDGGVRTATTNGDVATAPRNRGVTADVDVFHGSDIEVTRRTQRQIAAAGREFQRGMDATTRTGTTARAGANGLLGGYATVQSGLILKDALAKGDTTVAAAAAADMAIGTTAVLDDAARMIAQAKPEQAAKLIHALGESSPQVLQKLAPKILSLTSKAGFIAAPAAVLLETALEDEGYRWDRFKGSTLTTAAAVGTAVGAPMAASAIVGTGTAAGTGLMATVALPIAGVAVPVAGAIKIGSMGHEITTHVISHDKLIDSLKADLEDKVHLKALVSTVYQDKGGAVDLHDPGVRQGLRNQIDANIQKYDRVIENTTSPFTAALKNVFSYGTWGGHADDHMEAKINKTDQVLALEELKAWEKEHIAEAPQTAPNTPKAHDAKFRARHNLR